VRTLLRWLKNIVCFWLISLCMVSLAGLGCLGWVNHWRAGDWVAVDGTIQHLEASNRGHKRDKAPEDGYCGTLTCQYTYQVDGKTHSSDQVGFEWFDAEIRSRHYKALKESQEQGQGVRVWVDPDNPKESALFLPEFFSGMYFGPALAMVWFGSLIMLRIKERMDKGLDKTGA
jgi:Protein of unknown function (DUF3592)